MVSSLHRPNDKGQVWAKCVNPGNDPWELKSGKTIGKYTAVDSRNIDPIDVHALTKVEASREDIQGKLRVHPHLEVMLNQGAKQCTGQEQVAQFVRLLNQYADVFSKGEGGCRQNRVN